jgi:hypothetical protein
LKCLLNCKHPVRIAIEFQGPFSKPLLKSPHLQAGVAQQKLEDAGVERDGLLERLRWSEAERDEAVAQLAAAADGAWRHTLQKPFRLPLRARVLPSLTEGYTYAAKVWRFSIVQGPFSVAPCQP